VHDQAVCFQNTVDGLKHRLASPAFLQHMPEVQQSCRVRHLLGQKVQSHEFSHRITVVDRIFNALVRQVEPALQQVHAQHLLKPQGLSPARAVWIVERLNHLDPFCPRDDRFHLLQECFLARPARPSFVLHIAECLLHRLDHLFVDTSILQNFDCL